MPVRDAEGGPLDALRARGEAFLEAISTEYHAAYAGLKPAPQIQPIYAAHAAAYGDEAFAQALELLQGSVEGSEARRSARLLVDWLLESRVGRDLASLDEREIAWENAAIVALPDGSKEPYQRVPITLGNTRDAAARHTLDDARARLVLAELAPMRQEKLEREHEVVAKLGIAGTYNATWETLSGISLAALRSECEAFLRDTQHIWDDVFPEFLKQGLGITPAEATRADVAALMRAPEFDAHFT
ncbi:MAG: hypothetical protein C0503_12515, partial [Gemmatimonas sp.]|nr:hypothetical protein [Gemmatimonas sp.]